MTNYERMKNMTIEEMTVFLDAVDPCNIPYPERHCSDYKDCYECLNEWLQKEANND